MFHYLKHTFVFKNLKYFNLAFSESEGVPYFSDYNMHSPTPPPQI